jgi:hypothetical protein
MGKQLIAGPFLSAVPEPSIPIALLLGMQLFCRAGEKFSRKSLDDGFEFIRRNQCGPRGLRPDFFLALLLRGLAGHYAGDDSTAESNCRKNQRNDDFRRILPKGKPKTADRNCKKRITDNKCFEHSRLPFSSARLGRCAVKSVPLKSNIRQALQSLQSCSV